MEAFTGSCLTNKLLKKDESPVVIVVGTVVVVVAAAAAAAAVVELCSSCSCSRDCLDYCFTVTT